MNNPLATLFEQFLRERKFLKNVTPSTLVWYQVAFKNFQTTFPSHVTLPTKTTLQDFVIHQRERGLRPVADMSSNVTIP